MADVNTNEDVTKTTESVANTTENVAEIAIAKLKKELENIGKSVASEFENDVLSFLIERCKEDPPLAECICQEHKTWNKCKKYVNDKAMETIEERKGTVCVAVRNDTAYEWAEDYYRLDDKEEEERKAKEKAEREKAAAERAKKAKAAKKQEKSKPKKTGNAKTSSEPQKAKKNKNAIEGQTSLFDLM